MEVLVVDSSDHVVLLLLLPVLLLAWLVLPGLLDEFPMMMMWILMMIQCVVRGLCRRNVNDVHNSHCW
jgi:membrane protein required for beta-lactamase induction